jgi:hypothetical protein
VARTGEVFVPGGLPDVTYVARETLRAEAAVNDFLEERFRMLSLSGPTKCGKTVLVRRMVPQAMLISGGDIENVNDFWGAVVDKIGGYTEVSKEIARAESESDSREVSGELGVPFAKIGGGGEHATSYGETETKRVGKARPLHLVAQDALRANVDVVVFIDDFHYIPQAVQLAIVRGLKALIFDGLRVIVASVPHRAYDAVRVENEMTGRVEHFSLPIWSDAELEKIAMSGFGVLNVTSANSVTKRLADESFGSPHLMQDFCLNLCKENQVRETLPDQKELDTPDWAPFFAARATNASKAAFDMLAKGPPRTDRIPRKLTNGETTDIYGAVLAAIADTGPATTLPYDRLRGSLRNVLADEPPQRHEVTRVLVAMSKIARERIEGEPVVDYDETYEILHLSDPFFAFYLKWGAGANPKPVAPKEAGSESLF